MARAAARAGRAMLMMLVIVPFWTSFLIRIYAWINILQREGLLNKMLLALVWSRRAAGVALDRQRDLSSASSIPICRSWCCRSMPRSRRWTRRCSRRPPISAAPRWKAFWLVTVPLSLPGVVAGALLCFIPIVGEFVIPDLLGGSGAMMIGQTLWTGILHQQGLAGGLGRGGGAAGRCWWRRS